MMAGRKRKADARRQPGGRIDHSSSHARRQKAEDMRQVALEARTGVFGVTRTQAAVMPETSFLGQLCAQQTISSRQMDAATLFQEIMYEYDRLHPINGFPHSSPFDRMGGHDGSDGTEPSYRHRFERACDRFMLADIALWKANMIDRRAKSITERVVIWGFAMPHHVDALKVGLDYLADALDIPRKIAHAK